MHSRGLRLAEEQGTPEGPSVSLFGGWAPCPGCRMEFLLPSKTRGHRGLQWELTGVGVGGPRPELVDVLSPPPNILGFWQRCLG